MNVQIRRTVSGECLIFLFMLAFGFICKVLSIATNEHSSIQNAISRFSSDLASGHSVAWVFFFLPYVVFFLVRFLGWTANKLKPKFNKKS